ncbi:MAG TPA: adenylate/guanylate cyclase domain-containing protein [Nitrospiraceae bacterium]|nr:adenylate/guanylate cyclase domain-containing protein [Nitrospiraceae bacterium]
MELSKTHKRALSALAVALSVFLVIVLVQSTGWFHVAELKALDHLVRGHADPLKAHPDIVLVSIDESSLEAFGRWPWPRDRHGYVVRYLKQAGAKAIVFDLMFFEPDENAEEFDESFAQDVKAAGNVYLPVLLRQEPDEPDHTAMVPFPLKIVGEARFELQSEGPYRSVKFPISGLAQAARGLGFINLTADSDGPTRRIPLLAWVGANQVPHLALAVAQDLLGASSLTVTDGSLRIGNRAVPLAPGGTLFLNWHGRLEETYRQYAIGHVLKSFTQLEKGEQPVLDPRIFRDKIVFIAGTAAGLYDLRVTPFSSATPGVLIHMTALDNLLQQQFLRPVPQWIARILLLLFCIGSASSFMLSSSYPAKFGVTAVLALGWYGLSVHALSGHDRWLDPVFPEVGLALAFAAAATVEYLTEGKQRRQTRAAFDKYMSPEVVDEIMRNPEAIKLGGEKKEISIFFSDVAGFTTISERLSPEELVSLLNRYLSAMTDIIRSHRGNVNKYLGDGIMALFGAPLGEPNHATLACYAALESEAELARLREAWKQEGLPEIVARIGINSGPCIVGNMGSQTRLEYTVMGDCVNLASRLEGANKFYDTLILLGTKTFELAKDDIEAREVDLLRVKGKHEPVVVYELLARKGMLAPECMKVVAVYREGLAAYKARNFVLAEQRFSEALELDPSDGPSQVYLARSRQYLDTPPPPDWDGVYELKAK